WRTRNRRKSWSNNPLFAASRSHGAVRTRSRKQSESCMRTLRDVTQQLSVDPNSGLSDSAIEISQKQFGQNILTPLPKEPIWKKFLEKFDEPIIKILLAAALLSMIVDLFQHVGAISGGISFGVIALIILGAFVIKQGNWTPTLMFVSAI